ncbi:acylneuraminate cytidylyltransferase family protein [Roseospira marina]|uniref:Acylneuraminate cytidylyltransferase family protein n=1 Tax=Roseospira marina TaxID=140057 RepID=A0A5M6I8Q2_9PROT|nr:acylneuraminate cytidylyltransferase family protein [Roseospira marina]KAA5604307.1 acylneuraminate cytidylyltransferase family protein [Roseospira marina]MBB4315669.1 CMP-N-acetylneuraminic acid synthetase [Roseospira marina]MBB5088727.1 CMP-N-acetylneuraminic acid synthetase [Roseospira marina]
MNETRSSGLRAAVTAILPVRGTSERVPGKNRRPLAGRPLFHHILATLRRVPAIGTVVVNSDDPALLDAAKAAFPGIVTLRRPPALSAPETSMNAVLRDTVDRLAQDGADGGLLLQTHATNPFLTAGTITAALAAFRDAAPAYDSLFTVTRRQVRLWDGGGQPINHDPARLLPTQDLPPVFEENSCLYLFTAASLRAHGTRIGARPLLFETPALESLDIDDPADFALAEALAAHPARPV